MNTVQASENRLILLTSMKNRCGSWLCLSFNKQVGGYRVRQLLVDQWVQPRPPVDSSSLLTSTLGLMPSSTALSQASSTANRWLHTWTASRPIDQIPTMQLKLVRTGRVSDQIHHPEAAQNSLDSLSRPPRFPQTPLT